MPIVQPPTHAVAPKTFPKESDLSDFEKELLLKIYEGTSGIDALSSIFRMTRERMFEVLTRLSSEGLMETRSEKRFPKSMAVRSYLTPAGYGVAKKAASMTIDEPRRPEHDKGTQSEPREPEEIRTTKVTPNLSRFLSAARHAPVLSRFSRKAVQLKPFPGLIRKLTLLDLIILVVAVAILLVPWQYGESYFGILRMDKSTFYVFLWGASVRASWGETRTFLFPSSEFLLVFLLEVVSTIGMVYSRCQGSSQRWKITILFGGGTQALSLILFQMYIGSAFNRFLGIAAINSSPSIGVFLGVVVIVIAFADALFHKA